MNCKISPNVGDFYHSRVVFLREQAAMEGRGRCKMKEEDMTY